MDEARSVVERDIKQIENEIKTAGPLERRTVRDVFQYEVDLQNYTATFHRLNATTAGNNLNQIAVQVGNLKADILKARRVEEANKNTASTAGPATFNSPKGTNTFMGPSAPSSVPPATATPPQAQPGSGPHADAGQRGPLSDSFAEAGGGYDDPIAAAIVADQRADAAQQPADLETLQIAAVSAMHQWRASVAVGKKKEIAAAAQNYHARAGPGEWCSGGVGQATGESHTAHPDREDLHARGRWHDAGSGAAVGQCWPSPCDRRRIGSG